MMPQQVFFVERLPYLRGSLTGGSTVVYAVCKGGWGTGCVGSVGPVKDSLTYRLFCMVFIFIVGLGGVLAFFLVLFLIARML